MEQMNPLDPFKQGYLAFNEGRSRTHNPYEFLPEKTNWLRGWNDAADYADQQAWNERQGAE